MAATHNTQTATQISPAIRRDRSIGRCQASKARLFALRRQLRDSTTLNEEIATISPVASALAAMQLAAVGATAVSRIARLLAKGAAPKSAYTLTTCLVARLSRTSKFASTASCLAKIPASEAGQLPGLRIK